MRPTYGSVGTVYLTQPLLASSPQCIRIIVPAILRGTLNESIYLLGRGKKACSFCLTQPLSKKQTKEWSRISLSCPDPTFTSPFSVSKRTRLYFYLRSQTARSLSPAPWSWVFFFFDSTPLLSRLIFSYYVSSFLRLTLKKWIGKFQRGSCGVSLAVMVTLTMISGEINVFWKMLVSTSIANGRWI